jgi:hypothetical protein
MMENHGRRNGLKTEAREEERKKTMVVLALFVGDFLQYWY